jgi:hypothetical protein
MNTLALKRNTMTRDRISLLSLSFRMLFREQPGPAFSRHAFTALAALTFSAATLAYAPSAEASGLRYNCQNGPELTVIFDDENETRLRYVYDGPDSAMRTMRMSPNNPRRFSDGRATLTLRPNRATVEYREANFTDRCTAYHGF